MIYLKEASMEYVQKEYEFITQLPEDENGFTNSDYGCTYEEFYDIILPRYIESAKGIHLKPGHVPGTEYFLWDDDKIVGLFRIRHHLCEALANGAGHIGYGIRKEYRGMGYANEGLRLAIEKAWTIIPEDEIYMSVRKDNTASLKAQLRNGAYIHHEDGQEYFTRIKKNNTIRELMKRKSIRSFTDREITEEQRDQILLAAMAAPTAGNQQMYTIIDVQRQELKDQLAELCDHQQFIAKAKLVLIFLADYQKWFNAFDAAGASPRRPEEGDLFLAMIDACIAAQNAVTAAWSMGIGSCYVGDVMEQCESMRNLMNLPKYTFPTAMLVFGYPTKQQSGRKKPERCALSDIVCIDTYHCKTEDELKRMFAYRTENLSDEARKKMFADCKKNLSYETYMQGFCKRKYNSDFSREMSRSVREYLKDWEKTNESSK